jgi:hypothetical protein
MEVRLKSSPSLRTWVDEYSFAYASNDIMDRNRAFSKATADVTSVIMGDRCGYAVPVAQVGIPEGLLGGPVPCSSWYRGHIPVRDWI